MRQASARRRPRVHIMKGYHCSSDSVNLRVLYSVCVCVCVSLSSCVCALCSICIYCWGVWRSWYSATVILTLPVRPPDSTVYPTMLTVAASHSFLRTVLKLHSLSLILTKPLGSSISISAQERGRKEESEKRGSSPTFFVPGFFFSFFLFPFEVVRHSFKPHCTPTLNTQESVMNMYQHSIWQQ